jgi:outer membrane protein OmpA-like peptidoglycan-associated protein
MGSQASAQQGLRGEYYNGTNFEQKVMTRIDPQLNFTWKQRSPATGVDRSYYSIRWTGKLLAPASGRYTFYAKVDDGIRLWIGNQKVMDVWQLNDSKNFTGSIVLQKGQYYDLRVDYFNAMLGGVLELFWERPDDEKSFFGMGSTPRTPVTAQFFRQSPSPKPVVPPQKAVVAAKPKPTVKPPVPEVSPKPKPVIASVPIPKTEPASKPVSATVAAPVVPPAKPADEVFDNLASGETFNLRHVSFEQSSYVLLSSSSAELDRLVQVMKKKPEWRIEVAGHTDNVGDPRLNRALSENRAKVVAHYLIRHGIADDRIEAKGYGSSQPIADNTIETERVKNRRVEIKVR